MLLSDLYSPILHVVTATREESESCSSLLLTPLDVQMRLASAGQFNMVTVFGYGEIPVSISGIEGDGSIWHTVQSVGAVSRAFCQLKRGAIVGLRGPYGSSWPAVSDDVDSLIIIAGGLGLAALRIVLEAAVLERIKVSRFLACIGGRNPQGLPFWSELVRWKDATQSDDKYGIRIICADPCAVAGIERGLVTDLLPTEIGQPEGTQAFICGPEPMMTAAASRLIQAGCYPERIFLSIERNMKCGFGGCGHCQLQGHFVCRDGPIFAWPKVADLLAVKEL